MDTQKQIHKTHNSKNQFFTIFFLSVEFGKEGTSKNFYLLLSIGHYGQKSRRADLATADTADKTEPECFAASWTFDPNPSATVSSAHSTAMHQ
ncbi:uncharacterized protein encoded by LINC01587 [Pongo pygmaeus]|uniref:uncharacterized protein encoded by LINC01587 n=1 Tax=Pongo abelii TaxID=9601 RepID=UPI000CEFA90E|nr:uncharacterized protein encoded by LINC01587 [Pongo abelii]XP_054340750.1 uncharacterized protein encoded by LINC01587 [Pongo pygmaeus]